MASHGNQDFGCCKLCKELGEEVARLKVRVRTLEELLKHKNLHIKELEYEILRAFEAIRRMDEVRIQTCEKIQNLMTHNVESMQETLQLNQGSDYCPEEDPCKFISQEDDIVMEASHEDNKDLTSRTADDKEGSDDEYDVMRNAIGGEVSEAESKGSQSGDDDVERGDDDDDNNERRTAKSSKPIVGADTSVQDMEEEEDRDEPEEEEEDTLAVSRSAPDKLPSVLPVPPGSKDSLLPPPLPLNPDQVLIKCDYNHKGIRPPMPPILGTPIPQPFMMMGQGAPPSPPMRPPVPPMSRPTAVDKDDEPPRKKNKTEAQLIPEHVFLAQHQGMSMEDSNTLAFYNITPTSVVNLELKEKEGRKK